MNVKTTLDVILPAEVSGVNSLGIVTLGVVAASILFWYYLIPLYWRSRASAFLKQGRFELAIRVFDKTLRISPRDAKLWFGKGVTLHRAGRLNDSVDALMKAEELEPGQADVAFELAQVYREQKNYKMALGEIDKAVRLSVAPLSAMLTRCAIEIDGQMFEKAEQDCNYLIALEIESIDAQAYNLRGVARLALGRIEDAQADFETSYLLDPLSTETRVCCAAVWYRRDLFHQTLLLCDSILRVDETNALAFYYKGLAERSLGKDADAERDLNKSRELKRENVSDTISLGRRQNLF